MRATLTLRCHKPESLLRQARMRFLLWCYHALRHGGPAACEQLQLSSCPARGVSFQAAHLQWQALFPGLSSLARDTHADLHTHPMSPAVVASQAPSMLSRTRVVNLRQFACAVLFEHKLDAEATNLHRTHHRHGDQNADSQ